MAEGIPYPQAPQMTVQNPLQNISNLQALDQRQQAIAQQEMQMRAKMAVGRHMQANIDPQTGQLRNTDFLTSLAADPDAGPGFMEVLQGLHQLGEVDARTLGLKLEAKQKEMDIASNLFIPMLDKVRSGKGITKSELWGLAGQAVSKGLYEDSNKAVNAFMQMTGSIADSDSARADLVRRMAMSNENGRQALSANMLDAKSALAPVETMQRGVPGKIPAYETPFVPQGTRELYGQPATETTVEGASAPRPSPSVREGASPSAPPPASSFVPTGQSRQTEKFQEQQLAQFDKVEGQIAANVQNSVAIQQRLDEMAELQKEFKTGPGTELMMKLAGAAKMVGRDDLAATMMGNPGSKEAYAAAQAYMKLMIPNSLELLRNTLGGQGRITNLEVEQFIKANPNLETDPKAIEKMFNFMRRLGEIARAEQKAFLSYKRKAQETGQFDVSQFDSDWVDYLGEKKMLSKGLYKIQQPGGK